MIESGWNTGNVPVGLVSDGPVGQGEWREFASTRSETYIFGRGPSGSPPTLLTPTLMARLRRALARPALLASALACVCASEAVSQAAEGTKRALIIAIGDYGTPPANPLTGQPLRPYRSISTNFITSELKALNLTDTSLGFGDFGRIAQVMENPQRHVMWGASTDEQVSWTSGLGGGSSVFAYYLGQRLTEAAGSATLAQVHRLVNDDVTRWTRENTELQDPQLRGDRQSMTVAEFFRQR